MNQGRGFLIWQRYVGSHLPVLAGKCISWSQYYQQHTTHWTPPPPPPPPAAWFYCFSFILARPGQARPCPWISKHCMSSTSNFAIEFPIGFYLSHQVKIIMRELWRLAGRHYVFVTPTVSVSLSQSGNHVIILACLLCNITPTLHPATKHNYPRKSGTTNIHSERMIHFNALSLPPSISSQYLSECQYLKVRIPG